MRILKAITGGLTAALISSASTIAPSAIHRRPEGAGAGGCVLAVTGPGGARVGASGEVGWGRGARSEMVSTGAA